MATEGWLRSKHRTLVHPAARKSYIDVLSVWGVELEYIRVRTSPRCSNSCTESVYSMTHRSSGPYSLLLSENTNHFGSSFVFGIRSWKVCPLLAVGNTSDVGNIRFYVYFILYELCAMGAPLRKHRIRYWSLSWLDVHSSRTHRHP